MYRFKTNEGEFIDIDPSRLYTEEELERINEFKNYLAESINRDDISAWQRDAYIEALNKIKYIWG